jgi:hypothetical protein
MARFAKLSRLQWEIIQEIIAGEVWRWPRREPTRSRCVAKERAIARLIARGIIERCDDSPHFRLCVPLIEVIRHARDAWARDEGQGMYDFESEPRQVLDEIERRERETRQRERETRRRERRRVLYEQRNRSDAIRQRHWEQHRRTAVAGVVQRLEMEGRPVDAAAVCGVLGGIAGFDELTVANILASLRPEGAPGVP